MAPAAARLPRHRRPKAIHCRKESDRRFVLYFASLSAFNELQLRALQRVRNGIGPKSKSTSYSVCSGVEPGTWSLKFVLLREADSRSDGNEGCGCYRTDHLTGFSSFLQTMKTRFRVLEPVSTQIRAARVPDAIRSGDARRSLTHHVHDPDRTSHVLRLLHIGNVPRMTVVGCLTLRADSLRFQIVLRLARCQVSTDCASD